MVRDAVLVFVGGGLGSVLRWLTGLAALRLLGPAFPFGTLAVNIAGCFVMGLAFRLLPSLDSGTHAARLLLMTGLLGGYTTFSAFALDSAGLWLREQGTVAVLYVAASVGCSLLGVALGLIVGKWVAG